MFDACAGRHARHFILLLFSSLHMYLLIQDLATPTRLLRVFIMYPPLYR